MKHISVLCTCILLFGLLTIHVVQSAEQEDRYLQHFTLPTGEVVVVAEGEFEPRSIGSYSLRLYSGVMPEFPFDDFLDGVISRRDGTVESYRVLKSDGEFFSDAAGEAIQKFKYKPGTFKGKPVRFKLVEPFVFRLDK